MSSRANQFFGVVLALVLTGVCHTAGCLAACPSRDAMESKRCQREQPHDACADCILMHPPPAVPAIASPALPPPARVSVAVTFIAMPAIAMTIDRLPPLPTDLFHMKCQLTT
jgi:hypothetical protein